MNTNGRSLITTTDSRRAALWEKIFGSDTLPIVHAAPRLQHMQGRGSEVLAYDLDTSRLTAMQRARFASHLARVSGRPYEAAYAEIDNGASYPIQSSSDIRIIEPAVKMPLASLLQRLRVRPLLRMGW